MKPLKRAFYLFVFLTILTAFQLDHHEAYVYLCDSKSAYSYHLDINCRGLKRCTHDIIKVTKAKAINDYRRKLCGWED